MPSDVTTGYEFAPAVDDRRPRDSILTHSGSGATSLVARSLGGGVVGYALGSHWTSRVSFTAGLRADPEAVATYS